MPIDCKLVQKTSKSGNTYLCLEIKLTENTKKLVFLTSSEIELINLTYNKK